VGALLTLTAFGAGRFASRAAEPTATATAAVQERASQAVVAPEIGSPRPGLPPPLVAARAALVRELASPDRRDAAPILSPSDLPLEEAKLDARGGKPKSRTTPRRRVGDGF
jgi:hypothetical protein